MDGNGRWAKAQGLSRSAGHLQGAQNVRPIIEHAVKSGVKVITLYAFSKENWARPQDEKEVLFKIFEEQIKNTLDLFQKENGRLEFIGCKKDLSPLLQELMSNAEQNTQENIQFTVYVAMSYSGQQEIVDAIKSWQSAGSSELSIDELSKHMYEPDMPPVDLIIRTSGEQRMSNFLLWQSAYAELYFSPKFWPDFTVEDLDIALQDYATRERRYGHVHS